MCFIYSASNTHVIQCNSNEKSYSSLSYSDTTTKSFLSTVSQITTSCNVNSNDKHILEAIVRSFSKAIAAEVKYFPFKTEDPLPLEDEVLPNRPIPS